MLSKISHLSKSAFKPKQLLLRQNGDVKMVTLPSYLQVGALCAVISAATWVSISSYGFIKQQNQIETLEQQSLNAQSDWQQEKQKLQKQLIEQQEALESLEQQQTLLEGIVEALPEGVVKEPAKTTEQTRTESRTFQTQTNALANKQAQLLNHLDISLSARVTELNEQLDEIGLDRTLAASSSAQGGPYHQIDSGAPDNVIAVIDKLVEVNELEKMIDQLPINMPVAQGKYYISSHFGYRKDPFTGRRAQHKGVDLAGWHKTDITAPAAGVVTRAGKNGGYGKFIEIQHANGLKTRFGHLHTIKVKKGQQVQKSDVIALMGSTGRSTSTHLHYEVLQNNKHINPIKLAKVLSRVQ